jgi:hypothetical protein
MHIHRQLKTAHKTLFTTPSTLMPPTTTPNLIDHTPTITSAKQQISSRLAILVWAFLLASQGQTKHENAKSMICAMLGIQRLMPLFKYNSNIYIG